MAIVNFQPEIWSAELLVALEKTLVFGSLCNRDYEGEISAAGDTVRITSIAAPTIGTYTVHTDITVEDVDDSQQTLLIDQAKYFAFEVDDVEARQAAGNVLPEQTRKAGYGIADVIDQYIAGLLKTGAAGQEIATDILVSSAGAVYDSLVDLGVTLDTNNVPTAGRWVVLPPVAHGNVQKDTRFVGAGSPTDVRDNGLVGAAAGFTVYKSNNAPAGDGTPAGEKQIIAGHPMACSFAQQIVSVEAARMEKRFADMVKGLTLYGAKVVRPTALASVGVS